MDGRARSRPCSPRSTASFKAAHRNWCWCPAIRASASPSVVNELHKVLVPQRGLFAAGKFDQYKRDIPYSTLAQALQGLVRPLLAKSDVELGYWREAFREAMGPTANLWWTWSRS